MADQASASPLGPDPRVASAIAYAGWWASGALVWLVERDRPAVRFHAMQSMIAFGIVSAAWMMCWIGSFLMLVSSASGFFVLQRIAQLILVAGFIVWAVCVVQVSRGVDFRLPVVGDWASRLMTRVTSPRSNPPAQG
jgi:uncharacterized membrane protein